MMKRPSVANGLVASLALLGPFAGGCGDDAAPETSNIGGSAGAAGVGGSGVPMAGSAGLAGAGVGGAQGGSGAVSGNGGTVSAGAGAGGAVAGGASGASGAGGATAGMSGASGSGASGGASGASGEAGTAGSSAGSGGSMGGASAGCGKAVTTGTSQQTMTAFGLERGYYLSIPDSYDPMVPQRLVFGYHGSNYTGIMMRTYLDLEEAPLEEGSIFVYPDGLPLEGQPDHIAWELDEDGRDIAYFDELLAKLQSEFCIDNDRIFVNGQSFGGLMTNAVGCLRGDVVRAIAVVAGSGPRANSCQGQVAAWLTHGMDDESVDFASGEASRDHWVEANGCSTATMPGEPAECQAYQDCDPGHPVIWCPHVDDGGHQHPSFGREAVRQFLAQF
jgi:poly(3-hydroxybutyrate) depolymerase